MIPPEVGYDPSNPDLVDLRQSVLFLAHDIGHLWNDVKKAGHAEVMANTRANIKQRYENAYANKIKRTLHGKEVSSAINGFVKYETTNYSNSLVKPSIFK